MLLTNDDKIISCTAQYILFYVITMITIWSVSQYRGYLVFSLTLWSVFQYGGNPVSCAVALAVLHTIEEEKLQEQALRVGNYWINKVKEMMHAFPIIGDVRLVKAFLSIKSSLSH